MYNRKANEMRRRAYAEGMLTAYDADRDPDEIKRPLYEVETRALERIASGCASAWDVIAADIAAEERFALGCVIAEGDVGACPGYCTCAISGFVAVVA